MLINRLRAIWPNIKTSIKSYQNIYQNLTSKAIWPNVKTSQLKSVANVTNSINKKFNAMFTNDKLTVLNPQAQGFAPQHVSGSRNHNSAAYHNDYAENSGKVQRCVSRRVLDAENQHTVSSTAEYGNSGNSNVEPNPCPQFRVNAATWPNVNTPVASESNPNAALNAYLERQGRNENINLATQVGYDRESSASSYERKSL